VDTDIIDLSHPRDRDLRAIYQLRHSVFAHRLGWVSVMPDGLEIDRYDALSPTHIVVRDDVGRVTGCVRLMPANGPCLLRDTFSALLGTHPLPIESGTWEASRFAVDLDSPAIPLQVNSLLLSMYRWAASRAIHTLVCVTDTRFERLLVRSGLRTQRFSPPRQMNDCKAVAGHSFVTAETIRNLEKQNARMKVRWADPSHNIKLQDLKHEQPAP